MVKLICFCGAEMHEDRNNEYTCSECGIAVTQLEIDLEDNKYYAEIT